MAPFGMLLGVILGPISDQILILFLNPQNREVALPSHTFRYFSITKALILGPLFDHFFDPILGPPLEEPFGPPWPPKVPTLPPHVDFEPFLGPPLGSKMDLVAPRGSPKPCTKGVLEATRDRKGSQEPFLSILGTTWVAKAPFWHPPG